MLTPAKFRNKATDAQFQHAMTSGLFNWIQRLLTDAQQLGPTALPIIEKTIADVEAGDWFAVLSDAFQLLQLLKQNPVPTA